MSTTSERFFASVGNTASRLASSLSSLPPSISATPLPVLSSPALSSYDFYRPLPVLSAPALSTYDFYRFSTLQQTCPSVSTMCSSPSLSLVSIPLGASSLLYDVSFGSLRPLVPLELIKLHEIEGSAPLLLCHSFWGSTVVDPRQPVLVAGLLFSTQQQLQVISIYAMSSISG